MVSVQVAAVGAPGRLDPTRERCGMGLFSGGAPRQLPPKGCSPLSLVSVAGALLPAAVTKSALFTWAKISPGGL